MRESSEAVPKFGGGPHGVGDPDDLTLRKVELEVLIPQKMREIAKTEKCPAEVAAFTECCSKSSLAMVFSCQKQNQALKDCMSLWYKNPDFQNRCKTEYLAERSEFRRTGVTKKKLKNIRELKHEIEMERAGLQS